MICFDGISYCIFQRFEIQLNVSVLLPLPLEALLSIGCNGVLLNPKKKENQKRLLSAIALFKHCCLLLNNIDSDVKLFESFVPPDVYLFISAAQLIIKLI